MFLNYSSDSKVLLYLRCFKFYVIKHDDTLTDFVKYLIYVDAGLEILKVIWRLEERRGCEFNTVKKMVNLLYVYNINRWEIYKIAYRKKNTIFYW